MEKISTPDHSVRQHIRSASDRTSDTSQVGPSPLTLALIRQYARCCVPVKSADRALSAMIAN